MSLKATNINFMVAIQKRSKEEVIMIQPLGTMNIWILCQSIK